MNALSNMPKGNQLMQTLPNALFLLAATSSFVFSNSVLMAVEPSTSPATSAAKGGDHSTKPIARVTADEALAELVTGNQRFVNGALKNPRRRPEDFRAVADSQYPEAVIVACADSRVVPELLFDTGVGDLFVIRVAGNVVDGAGVTVKGSIEYAIAELHVPLVVVLGHSNCGAVKAAVTHIEHKDSLPGAINGLVELIKTSSRSVQKLSGDIYVNTTWKMHELESQN